MSELNQNAEITEWDLDEWSNETRAELTAMLVEAEVAHRWEKTVLLAESAREADVEEILDEIENMDSEIDEQDGHDDDESQIDEKVLQQLLAVSQKISQNPSDSNAVAKLERLLEEVDGAGTPGDMSDSVWRQIKDLTSQIEEALVGGDRADETTAMDLAGRLTAILRSNL